MTRTWIGMLAGVLLLEAVLSAGTKFTSTWVAPEAKQADFAGKKIATLVLSADETLRISIEEGLARELTARGLQAIAAYRLVPREELKIPEKARAWFERAGVQGVVAMRPVSMEQEKTYVPGTWTAPYYGTLWGYYGYGWGAPLYDPGYVRSDTVLHVETLIYSVPMNKLLWAGASETKNPKEARFVLAEIVKEAGKQMRKQGLISSPS